jgi:hypothetical protein
MAVSMWAAQLSCVTGGNAVVQPQVRMWSAIPVLGVYPREVKSYVHAKTRMWMFTATNPSVDEWMSRQLPLRRGIGDQLCNKEKQTGCSQATTGWISRAHAEWENPASKDRAWRNSTCAVHDKQKHRDGVSGSRAGPPEWCQEGIFEVVGHSAPWAWLWSHSSLVY